MSWTTPASWDFKEAPGAEKMNQQIRDNLNYLKSSLPAGVMMDYGGVTAPDQWLLCNGAAISRTTYADLFAAIGTTYGLGDGGTTFNVPDFRGRGSIGAGQGTGLTNRVLGTQLGAETHTHTFSGTTGYESSADNSSGSGEVYFANNNHTHTVSGTTGSGSSLQPSLVVTKIIKY